VKADRVKKGLKFLISRSKAGSTKAAHDTARTSIAVARHWVKVSAEELDALRELRKKLDSGNQGMSASNRDRLRQFDDPQNVKALLALARRVRCPARRWRCGSKDARRRADPAWLAGLPTPASPGGSDQDTDGSDGTGRADGSRPRHPVDGANRRKNLTRLHLERNLQRTRSGILHLVIPAAEMKNNQAFETILPPSTTKLIDMYLERYRPLLLTTSNPWLFPGVGDRPKSCERLALQVTECVRKRCGLQVHLHLFRHLSAKLFLDANPGQYGIIRLLHGHRSVETTTKFYCQIAATAAVKAYDRHVTRSRTGTSSPYTAAGGLRGTGASGFARLGLSCRPSPGDKCRNA
jgi:hypothetical protein